MGSGRLNVYVMAPDDPCHVDGRTWLVSIYQCGGQPLVWCDRKFAGLPARCGHAELDLPPGCYSVVASWRPEIWPMRPIPTADTAAATILASPGSGGILPGPLPPFPSIYTDHAVVTVACEGISCVQLFNPSARRRAVLLDAELRALEQSPESGRPASEVLSRARTAIGELLGALPQATQALELGDVERR